MQVDGDSGSAVWARADRQAGVDFGSPRAILLASASFAVLLLQPAGASATHRGVGVVDEVTLEVGYHDSSIPGGPGQLTARLLVEGSPLAGMDVEFWREVDFLGPRRIVLGTRKTAADGTASVSISLSESALSVGARFAGNESYLAAQQTTEISPSVAAPPESPAPTRDEGGASLALVSSVMPALLALTVLAIWFAATVPFRGRRARGRASRWVRTSADPHRAAAVVGDWAAASR